MHCRTNKKLICSWNLLPLLLPLCCIWCADTNITLRMCIYTYNLFIYNYSWFWFVTFFWIMSAKCFILFVHRVGLHDFFPHFQVKWTVMHSWLKKVKNGFSGSDSEETYWSNTTLSERVKVSRLYFVAHFDCNLNQMSIFSSCWSVLLWEFNQKVKNTPKK